MTTLKQFHWFWAWDDDKEEIWLRKMANKGWHFVSFTGLWTYNFVQGEPRDVVYRLDHQSKEKDKADYVQLFQDAGWEYAGQSFNGWQYFRKEAMNGEAPDIFSDNESKARKYRNFLFMLIAILPIFIINIINLNKRTDTLSEVFTFIFFLFILLYGYSIMRLGSRIQSLTRKKI